MNLKTYKTLFKGVDQTGIGTAEFAELGTVDKDGDLTDPGAFGNQLAHLLPMHVWKDADTPFLGVAQISEARNKAIARFELNMDLQRARDWHSSLKFALDRGKTIEWSYGFDVVDSEMRTVDGKSVRVLKKLLVHEVSPVVVGAGNNTQTTSIKTCTNCGPVSQCRCGASPKNIDQQITHVMRETAEILGRFKGLNKTGRVLSFENKRRLDELATSISQLGGRDLNKEFRELEDQFRRSSARFGLS